MSNPEKGYNPEEIQTDISSVSEMPESSSSAPTVEGKARIDAIINKFTDEHIERGGHLPVVNVKWNRELDAMMEAQRQPVDTPAIDARVGKMATPEEIKAAIEQTKMWLQEVSEFWEKHDHPQGVGNKVRKGVSDALGTVMRFSKFGEKAGRLEADRAKTEYEYKLTKLAERAAELGMK